MLNRLINVVSLIPNCEGARKLLELCADGNWEALKGMPVFTKPDGTVIATFEQNNWKTKGHRPGVRLEPAYNFKDIRGPFKKQLLCDSLTNELKAAVIAWNYYDTRLCTHQNLTGHLRYLRHMAYALQKMGINTFNGLDADVMLELIESGSFSAHDNKTFCCINRVWENQATLPYDLPTKFGHEALNLDVAKARGKTVIPLNLYLNSLVRHSEFIREWWPHRAEINHVLTRLLATAQCMRADKLDDLRHARRPFNSIFSQRSIDQTNIKYELSKALAEQGMRLVDHGEGGQRWLDYMLWNHPGMHMSAKEYNDGLLVVAGKSFTVENFKALIRSLSESCIYLCMALSGMRGDELVHMHSDFCAQRLELPTGRNNEVEELFLLHTGTNKITLHYKGTNDVFVTTKTGYDAAHLLNSIHEPYRKYFPADQRHYFLSCLGGFLQINPALRIHNSIKTLKNKESEYWRVSDEDLSMLKKSDPDCYEVKLGDIWPLSGHQLRRSLAYYLVGFELCDFPQLKQQFSHFSVFMTMYYARNASSLKNWYQEVESQRIDQKAVKYAHIFKRLADGHRLAGGKGKQFHRDALTNPIEEKYSDRRMSVEYWREEISGGRADFHAIAPNMYCTNRNCELRIEIDLSECVDCDFDIIEAATYAEVARQEAMRQLVLAEDEGWLDAGQVSRDIVRIKSAEKIMSDLDVPYTAYTLTIAAEKLLIPVNVTMNDSGFNGWVSV
ncbi:hypothetical protein [Moritella dasanensis]|uniref:hypothetical protein n=1 Tax=Moritella dasanensis TaxID=428031 RepID=UPI0002DA2108|nr:hypothetical protein [Moritella dasanensis]